MLIFGLAALAAPPFAAAAPGDLDPSFGTSGKVLQAAGARNAGINAAVKQPDGKIVVAGFAEQSASEPYNSDFLVARFNANGTLDTSFNPGGATPGIQTTPMGNGAADDTAYAVALGPDGTIYVAGATNHSPPAGGASSDFAVARYTSAGAPDPGFAEDGTHVFSRGSYDVAYAVAVQADGGKPILAGRSGGTDTGMYVMRLDPSSGALDPTFNAGGPTPGVQDIRFGDPFLDAARALAFQPDGQLVVAGNTGSNSDLAIARLNGDGTLDTGGFGSGSGKATIPQPGNQMVNALVLHAGRPVLAGETLDLSNGHKDWILARFTAAGIPDAAFSGDGVQVTPFTAADGTQSGAATGLVVDGAKLVATGWAFNCPGLGCADFAAARYLDDGSLDASFGTGGQRTYDIGGRNDFAMAAVPGSAIALGMCDNPMERALLCGAEIDTDGAADSCPESGRPAQTQIALPTECRYDLAVRVSVPTTYPRNGTDLPVVVRVTNEGSKKSPESALRFALYTFEPRDATGKSLSGTALHNFRQQSTTLGNDCSITTAGPRLGGSPRAQCEVKALDPRQSARVTFHADTDAWIDRPGNSIAEGRGAHAFSDVASAIADVGKPEPPSGFSVACDAAAEVKCDNNSKSAKTKFEPEVTIKLKEGELTGKAAAGPLPNAKGDALAAARRLRIRKVEVAVRRLGTGKRCRWLANRKGRLRSKRARRGQCLNAIWLRARGTTTWRFTLPRTLPRGRYAAYARATDSRGVTNHHFSPKLNNRLNFRRR